jgi:hypothetical protein
LRRDQNEFGLRIKRLEATMERSSRILKLKDFLRKRASSMSFFSLCTSTKWCSGEEEYNSFGYGKDHA